MSTLPAARRAELDRVLWPALGAGIVALVACGISALGDPAPFLRAYLAAYQFYLGIALGCFAVLMIYHLTGGAWGFLIRRILEAGMRTLPLLAVFCLPIALGVEHLYPWAGPADAVEKLKFNHFYLQVPFFWGRAVVIFAAWLAIASILNSWSRQQDETVGAPWPRKFGMLSAPGLAVYGVTITFASVDWVMSVQPEFHSTIFGPLYVAGQLLTGHALAVLVLAWLAQGAPVEGAISPDVLNDLGNLLFTFLVIWAYMAFFQFMLIWMANLPEEVIWYLPRSQGGWQGVAWALFLFHFAVPFFLLLMRDVKRNSRSLARVAALILVMHMVFQYFQVLPAFPETSWTDHWIDFVTPIGIGGVWLAYFLWQLQRYPVLPRHDPSREEAARLHRHDLEAAAQEEGIEHG
jgi:hypothetical protein